MNVRYAGCRRLVTWSPRKRSEEHTSELQSRLHLVCRLLLEKKKTIIFLQYSTILLMNSKIFRIFYTIPTSCITSHHLHTTPFASLFNCFIDVISFIPTPTPY